MQKKTLKKVKFLNHLQAEKTRKKASSSVKI